MVHQKQMIKNNTTKEYIINSLKKTHSLVYKLFNSEKYIASVDNVSKLLVDSINSNHCVFLAGNGGSAAHAQHFSAEFVSRFNFDRNPLPAIALTTDSSILTAIANDYGYDKVFERQLGGLARSGDVFIGFTTSGKSKNIINAFKKTNEMNILSIGICGEMGIEGFKPDLEINIPSSNTPLIQEMHGITCHLICDIVEKSIFPNQ